MKTPRLILSLFIGAALCAAAALLTGCQTAHKKADTVHELWEYQPITNGVSKPVALLTRHEVWRDRYKGGGNALLSDPKATQIDSEHQNQTALGGTSALKVGEISAVVNTNAINAVGGVISNIGTAVGNVIKQ